MRRGLMGLGQLGHRLAGFRGMAIHVRLHTRGHIPMGVSAIGYKLAVWGFTVRGF